MHFDYEACIIYDVDKCALVLMTCRLAICSLGLRVLLFDGIIR